MTTYSSECLFSVIGNRTPKTWIVPVLLFRNRIGKLLLKS
jgi:hypothetical protein